LSNSTANAEASDVKKSTKTKSVNNDSVQKAVDEYRKMREDGAVELTEQLIADINKECEKIENRETITQDSQHEPTEITSENGSAALGPPTLTRFEKARIMGARALQLSLGAPVFIKIPKNAITSLEIAMEELNQRLLPIVIKRSLPNKDYQNIPIDKFE